MTLFRCPRDRTIIREIVTRNVFTKHGACPTCKTVYVIWGRTMTRCQTPLRCAGPKLQFLEDLPARSGRGISRPFGPRQK